MEQIRIAIVDDHPIVRAGVVRLLDRRSDFTVVAEGGSFEDALRIADESVPDVMLLDVSMPGGGINAARAIALSAPLVKIVFLTVAESEATIGAAMEVGARAYVLKGVGGPDLVNTIANVASSTPVVLPGMAARILAGVRDAFAPVNGEYLPQFSTREIDVLSRIAQKETHDGIGEALDLPVAMVARILDNIVQKTNLRHRMVAAVLSDRAMRGSGDGGAN